MGRIVHSMCFSHKNVSSIKCIPIFCDRSATCSLNLVAISPKARVNVYFFMIWFSPGVSSERKVINTFTYSKNGALRSMKQGSCIMHH